MAYYGYDSQWPEYVSVAERRRRAMIEMAHLKKKGVLVQPVEIEGRKITRTFWGQAWCDHMESLGDYENRLPRGRTYVRNGSVCHLEITKGCVSAMVSGSSLYKIEVKIDILPKAKWKRIKKQCAGEISSLLELLQGKLSSSVMEVVSDLENGLFPSSEEIHLDCDCPDWAHLCKHLAAVLYGVGARLDKEPELLFLLRGVNHEELIEASASQSVTGVTRGEGRRRRLDESALSDVFGIDLNDTPDDKSAPSRPARQKKRVAKKKNKISIAKRATDKVSVRTRSKSTNKKKTGKSPAKSENKQKKKSKKKSVSKKTTRTKASPKKTNKKTATKKTPARRNTAKAAAKKKPSAGKRKKTKRTSSNRKVTKTNKRRKKTGR